MIQKNKGWKGPHLLLSRRQALVSIGLAAFHGAARSLSKRFRPALWRGTSPASDTGTDGTVDARLRADLARLAPRAYSEEGIPMFLSCVNLVPVKMSHQVPKVTLTPLSAALASALRVRPNAEAKDIAPIIEVLADRDFTLGETTERS